VTRRCIMVFLYKWENGEPRYLLLKRNRDLGGYWQPVTGFIEAPETNRQAALRELVEETGIEIYERVTDPNHYFFFDMNGTQCSVSVLAVEVYNPPDIRISFEHTDHRWLTYQEARQTLFWENNVDTLDKLHMQLTYKSGG
jgi:dihydroneopterin triphosphate diphosphatase